MADEQLCEVVLDCRWALADAQRKRARPADTVRALALAAMPVESPLAKAKARDAMARWVSLAPRTRLPACCACDLLDRMLCDPGTRSEKRRGGKRLKSSSVRCVAERRALRTRPLPCRAPGVVRECKPAPIPTSAPARAGPHTDAMRRRDPGDSDVVNDMLERFGSLAVRHIRAMPGLPIVRIPLRADTRWHGESTSHAR